MTDRGRNPDRLGDAIRELARTMAENGQSSMRFAVVTQTHRAHYEVRLIATRERGHFAPRPQDHVIEVDAFGPEPSQGSRQMAESK